MPLYTLCCKSEVTSAETRFCPACGLRCTTAACKQPESELSVSSFGSGRKDASPQPKYPSDAGAARPDRGALLDAVTPLEQLSALLKSKLTTCLEGGSPPAPSPPASPGQGSEHTQRGQAIPKEKFEVADGLYEAVARAKTLAMAADEATEDIARRKERPHEVEIVGMAAEPQYNGCKGTVVKKMPSGEYLVRLSSTAAFSQPWRGALGGRGQIPQHERTLPWEGNDRHTTRMKDVYNVASLAPVNALAIPGSLEVERSFAAANIKFIASATCSRTSSMSGTYQALLEQRMAASPSNRSRTPSNQRRRQPWEVFGIRGKQPTERPTDGRDLPWASPPPSRPGPTGPSSALTLWSMSPKQGGERPMNACPLRSKSRDREPEKDGEADKAGLAKQRRSLDRSRQPEREYDFDFSAMESRASSFPMERFAYHPPETWEPEHWDEHEKRKIESKRQRLAMIEAGSLSRYHGSRASLPCNMYNYDPPRHDARHSVSPDAMYQGSPASRFVYRTDAGDRRSQSKQVSFRETGSRSQSPPGHSPPSVRSSPVGSANTRSLTYQVVSAPSPSSAYDRPYVTSVAEELSKTGSVPRSSRRRYLEPTSLPLNHHDYALVYDLADNQYGLPGMVKRKKELSYGAANLPGGSMVCAEIRKKLSRVV